jgi:hypothetical protein
MRFSFVSNLINNVWIPFGTGKRNSFSVSRNCLMNSTSSSMRYFFGTLRVNSNLIYFPQSLMSPLLPGLKRRSSRNLMGRGLCSRSGSSRSVARPSDQCSPTYFYPIILPPHLPFVKCLCQYLKRSPKETWEHHDLFLFLCQILEEIKHCFLASTPSQQN